MRQATSHNLVDSVPVPTFSTPVNSRWVATCVGLLVLTLVTSSPAVADLWYQHYQKAEQAIDRSQWEEAIEELNQAIERRGDSGARVRTYGMRTTDYFPYLKLGIAYLHLGQTKAALQAFETEERLGAVNASEEGSTELQTYKRRASDALADAAAGEEQRIQQILRDSLEEAQRLRAEDKLEEAMLALGRGMAVAPDDRAASELMSSLRQQAQRQQEARIAEQQATEAVSQGEEFLDQGAYSDAASQFRRALTLKGSDPEIEELLDRSQRLLREEIQAREMEAEQETNLAQMLDEAATLESAGDLDRALDSVQAVLAMDPTNRRAWSLESRLIEARTAAERESSRMGSVAAELAAAEEHFKAGRFEAALSAANRAIAVDPGNPAALEMVGRSYQEISQVLLGRNARGNIPPAIRFADFRDEREDGSRVETVRDSRFRLSGVVIDNTPVKISFTDDRQNVLPAATQRQQLGDFYLTEFQLDTELNVGNASIRLLATDAEELSSSSEYLVVYARPWYRSPWFVTATTLILLVVAWEGATRRLRRRRRRRRRRYNPYVAGAPVLDEALFFGRDQLIDRILQTIHNNSLLLYGERRIGKTSIQHHLKRRLQELDDPVYAFYPVYVDLQGTPEERFFATIAEDVKQELAPQLQEVEIGTAEREDRDYAYRDLVRDLRMVIKHLEEHNDRKVKLVLLIDEVDELNDYDPRINQRLRSLFMKSFAESLVAVVSGVEIKKHWERVGSPWYNFFEEIEVLPLSEAEARSLVEAPIAGVLKLEQGVADRIVELTERRPYLIQKVCISLVNQAYEKGRSVISMSDLAALDQLEAA